MRTRISRAISRAAMTIAFAAMPALAEGDTIHPSAVWLDNNRVAINAHGGGMLLHRGTYYWYGEHKIEGTIGNTAQVGVHVYASRDLVSWTDKGIAFAVSDNPASDITKGSIIERPKVVYNAKTKKFVMWFHLELKGQGYKAARNGVAVSDTPAGPFRYLGSTRPDKESWPIDAAEADKVAGPNNRLANDFAAGQESRDMTIFQDDDGRAYLVYASEDNHSLHLSQLTDDYLKTSGRYTRILPGVMMEGPALFKRNGTYYMIASGVTGWTPNPAHSLKAPSIWGPWTELDNPVRGRADEIATTFCSQSTFVLPVGNDHFIFMADRWNPKNAIDGHYVWLPISWEGDKPVLHWVDEWKLSK